MSWSAHSRPDLRNAGSCPNALATGETLAATMRYQNCVLRTATTALKLQKNAVKIQKQDKVSLELHVNIMLLRFAVANSLSIRDEVELSFLAAPLKERSEQVIPSKYSKHGVLPVVALYGANASGKSNLLAALALFRSMVLRSFKESDGEPELPHRPFLLDDESKDKESSFVLDFVMEESRYQYGVVYGAKRVEEEWLYAFPSKIKQVLFSRNAKEAEEYYFGRNFHGKNRQIQSITRPHVLFLSAAATSGHPLLAKISSFFEESLVIRMASSTTNPDSLARSLEKDSTIGKDVVRYLSLADTGIADFRIATQKMPDEMKVELKELFAVINKLNASSGKTASPDQAELKNLELGHTSADGKIRYIDFGNESLGTRHLLTILPPVLNALRKGSTLVLDEITTSLHTLLAQKLVGVFQDRELNPQGAQLVFSTHDTNLLAPGILRRDEIWFAEKSTAGVSIFFPLTDIETKNTDNIERGYVQGRFGAIPFVRFD